MKPLVSQFLIILGENGKLQLLQTVHILELRPALVLFVTKLNKKMFQPTEFIPGLIGKLLLIYVQKKKKAYRSCSYCHTQETTIIPASNHVWGEWYIDKKPTIFKTGVRMRYCINCLTEDKIIIPKQKMTTAQKQVKKSVDRFFKYAKQYNTSKLTKCFTKPSSVKLFIENSYMPQYYKKYNKRISYELKSIKVSGKNATVKLSYKYPNRYNVFKAAFENSVYYQLKNPNISESQLLKYMYERICVHSKAGIDYSYGNLTLKLKKSGSAWKITSFNSKIDNLLHSNYTKAYNDYF